MKQISDSDYALLMDKLPLALAAAVCDPDNHAAANAVRRLQCFLRKHHKINQKKSKPDL